MQNSNKAEHGFETESRRFSYELFKLKKFELRNSIYPQENNLFLLNSL